MSDLGLELERQTARIVERRWISDGVVRAIK